MNPVDAPKAELIGRGDTDAIIGREEQAKWMAEALEAWGMAPGMRILVLAPDFTRYHSGAGELTSILYELAGAQCRVDVLPTLGTHLPMDPHEIKVMYPGVPLDHIIIHNWRTDTVTVGLIPVEFIEKQSEGKLHYSMYAELNKSIVQGRYDLIVSIGQVVPHEVIGMANHNKNLFVGAGGADFLNKSHFLGAVYGMERIMGRIDTPVRAVTDFAESFIPQLPVKYVLTVKGRDEAGDHVLRGLFIGEGRQPYVEAARLAQKVNLMMLDAPIKKALVYLDPKEFKSTWLGNKAIYRTRMAMADDGELIVLGPGVNKCGEDKANDVLIRMFGYCGTPKTLKLVEDHEPMRNNLSVAAHLIHGSSEGRFRITYAAGGLSRAEVEGLGFEWADPAAIERRFKREKLLRGPNETSEGEVFYVDNPAQGLWALRRNFI